MPASRVFPAALVAFIAISRWLCRSRALYDLDSINFALALRRFDPGVHQPHPPGYFLYVQLGRVVNGLVGEPNSALVLISMVASCAAGAMIFRMANAWFGRGAAAGALLLFAFSPLAWFHGTVALTYILEAFFSALVGYWCWRAWAGESAWVVPAAAALALASGFRPSFALFLGPLWLAAAWRARWTLRLLGAATGMAVALAWAIPMLRAAGGLEAYGGALWHLAGTVPARRTTLADPALAVARLITVFWAFLMCFGCASVLLLRGLRQAPRRRWKFFVGLWLAPGAAFFVLVFLNYVNLGYLLVLCPPLFAVIGALTGDFLAARRRRALLALAAAAAHCAFYLAAPVYCSFRGVREFERQLAAALAAVRAAGSPRETVVVGFDAHFLGFRHAGYYAPEYLTVLYPEIRFGAARRAFVMHARDTRAVDALPVAGRTRYVFFPLPEGAEYRRYLDRILGRLPPGSVPAVRAGGPIAALQSLFPATYPH